MKPLAISRLFWLTLLWLTTSKEPFSSKAGSQSLHSLITLLKREQRDNLGMAASDFVAPLLTGEKKDGGPPGLLGEKSGQ